MPGIAIIGWGSLIWDLDTLAPLVTGPWRMDEGPRLPMEFSRISPKRKMGLAVCLDFVHGAPCSTHWIRSVRTGVADAIADLAAREWTTPDRIGAVCPQDGTGQGRPEVVDVIADWCGQTGLAGAVWTDITPNFDEERSVRFSAAAATAYLQTLSGDSLDEAVRYIQNAPAATDTPLRRSLAQNPWWQNEAARVGALDRAARNA